MLPQEIIRRKRDGLHLSDAEIADFVKGIASGAVGEAQMAAFAMTVLLKGLDEVEKTALTRAMARSGAVLDWTAEELGGPVLDKHSTGGVGDKVSLILAPIVAACGGFVPMLSGRGLGHTGGTLDKMAAIPGYRIQPDLPTLRQVVKRVGCAIVGATDELAPADRRLYAVRDVSATVESIDLLTTSILSKKLTEGLDGLVLDVKVGSGAFMPTEAGAMALAASLVQVGRDCDLRIAVLLTDMNAVLGRTAGNALEAREAIEVLKHGAGDKRLVEVTLALTAELLYLGGLAPSLEAGRAAARHVLQSGAAADRFARMVAALGGPADLVDEPDRHLARAPIVVEATAEEGYVTDIDVRRLGLVIVGLGGGRTQTDQTIDPAVGLSDVAGVGDAVGRGRPLALIHARDRDAAARAAEEVRGAFTLTDGAAPHRGRLVLGRIAP